MCALAGCMAKALWCCAFALHMWMKLMQPSWQFAGMWLQRRAHLRAQVLGCAWPQAVLEVGRAETGWRPHADGAE